MNFSETANDLIIDIFPMVAASSVGSIENIEYQISVLGQQDNVLHTSGIMRKKGSAVSQNSMTNFTSGLTILNLRMKSSTSENSKYFWDNGCMVIKISVFITQSEVSRNPFVEIQSCNSDSNPMFKDLKGMFETMRGSDVTIQTADGVKLNAHKTFLMARSKTFDTMFTIDMTEKETKNIIVKDFDSIVFTELLRFMYYNEVENMKDVHIDLYKAAMRYEVKLLPEKCLLSIENNIHDTNILEVIQLGCVYDLKWLFRSGINIFIT